jgi:hypothetical protein
MHWQKRGFYFPLFYFWFIKVKHEDRIDSWVSYFIGPPPFCSALFIKNWPKLKELGGNQTQVLQTGSQVNYTQPYPTRLLLQVCEAQMYFYYFTLNLWYSQMWTINHCKEILLIIKKYQVKDYDLLFFILVEKNSFFSWGLNIIQYL